MGVPKNFERMTKDKDYFGELSQQSCKDKHLSEGLDRVVTLGVEVLAPFETVSS